jgi:hypothetical protein
MRASNTLIEEGQNVKWHAAHISRCNDMEEASLGLLGVLRLCMYITTWHLTFAVILGLRCGSN